MKKSKSKSIFTGLSLAIFSSGILLGISALLFVGVVQKNGLTQSSQAASPKKTTPLICSNGCVVDNSQGDMNNQFQGKDFTNAYLADIVIHNNVDFTNALLVNADLLHSSLNQDNFTNVDFSSSNLSQSSVGQDVFVNANFTSANIQNWIGAGNNDFTGANFTNANLNGGSFGGNNFTGAIWSNTTCADGTNSNNDGNTCIGHLNGQ